VLVAPPGATADVTQAAREVMRKLDEFITENQKSFKAAIENIEKFTGALAKNTQSIDSTLANIDKFSTALGRNSERVDRIAEGLQNLAGGEDGKSGEINEAARSIRKLADHLDQRTAEITAGINRLTQNGSREIQSLSSDARRTLSTIDRAVQNFDKNPSRLIWGGSGGGSSLPEYNGRR